MRINSVQQQNFKGSVTDKVGKLIMDHPVAVAGLAGSSVIAQKIVMSGSEAVIGPIMDVGIGKAITKVTNEKDGRTNPSSKVQAVRTFSQSVGGTIVGVAIRAICITGAVAACMKIGSKAGSKIGEVLNPPINKLTKENDLYKYTDKMSAWGKAMGGALATLVMLVTNFVIDAPFINFINKKVSEKVLKKPIAENTQQQNDTQNAKEAK